MNKSKRTRVESDFRFLKQRGLKPNVLFAIRTYSFYDSVTGTRKILKSEVSGRKLSRKLCDANKDNVTKSVTILRSQGVLKEDGEFYLVSDIPQQRSSREVSTDFMKRMLRDRSGDYTLVYLWLSRRLSQKRSQGKFPFFSIGDIIKGIYLYETRNAKVYKKIQTILIDMLIDGTVDWGTIKIDNTWLKYIKSVNENFVFNESISQEYEKIFDTINDSVDTDKNFDMTMEEVELYKDLGREESKKDSVANYFEDEDDEDPFDFPF